MDKKKSKGVWNNFSGKGKFDAACKEIQASTQKYIETHSFQLEEEDEKEEDLPEDDIIGRILQGYDAGNDNIERTSQHLQEAFKSNALICLICIDNIKRSDKIWGCSSCFNSFHLGCIQKWAKDSVFQQVQVLENSIQPFEHFTQEEKDKRKKVEWACPKCRSGYAQSSIPSKYFCFCGKIQNPIFDPWLIPHSCGDKCKKPLQPSCGHSCLLLCHPGPCPPCPVMVKNYCYCESSAPKMRRCSAKEWSCLQTCGKLLGCRQHECNDKCHVGSCATCPKLSKQRCQCKRNEIMRPCADPVWQCKKMCNKTFPCKAHKCDVVCHSGNCGRCPQSGERSCPCGKVKAILPCTEMVPTCGDSCSKELQCGKHYCAERCHKGACPSCIQYSVKRCLCRAKEKELACSKVFTCESKCKKSRDCGKHSCNRKCCPGNCPPCDHPCGSTLKCGSHKCQSRCHPGMCYPCSVTHTVSCPCGISKVTVPCGREKQTKKPKCTNNCRKKASCHHSKQERHRCHEGDCPPCKQVCLQQLPCKHTCPEPCHDAVPIKVVNKYKPATPWEVAGPQIQIKVLPCSPCMVPVTTICLGEHETPDWPCSDIRPYSCGRKCGRKLACTNDTCDRECHTVEGASDKVSQGTNCRPCERQCSKPSPCAHMCRLRCHPGQCPVCQEYLKLKCHCGILQLMLKCSIYTAASDKEKQSLRSCKSQCSKMLPCSHQCQLQCHMGVCSPRDKCRKKITVRCPCKRVKKEFVCNQIFAGVGILRCDDICKEKEEERLKIEREKKEEEEFEEREKNRREVEGFERRLEGKKKRRPRRVTEDKSVDVKWWQSKTVIIPVVILFIGVGFYWVY